MDPEIAKTIVQYVIYGLLGGAAGISSWNSRQSKKAALNAETSAATAKNSEAIINELRDEVKDLKGKVQLQAEKIALLENARILVAGDYQRAKELLNEVQQERDTLQLKNKQLEEDKRMLETQLSNLGAKNAEIEKQLNAEIKEINRLQGEIVRLTKEIDNQAQRITYLKAGAQEPAEN